MKVSFFCASLDKHTMEFIETSKGGSRLVKDNFIYHKNKTLSSGCTYWECSKRRQDGRCKVKITLDEDNQFIRQSGEHTHPPDPEGVLAAKARAGIKSL